MTKYDLEERTFMFAKRTAVFINKVPRTLANIEYLKQLLRSSASIAANYIEANESVGKRDFFFRLKICRKESKESRLWFRLIDVSSSQDLEREQATLAAEAKELTLIFAAILRKSGAIK